MTEFQNTVSFTFKAGLSKDTRETALSRIQNIRGVFALQASTEADTYDVQMDEPKNSAAIGHAIAQHEEVQSTTITPAAFHELKAKIAAGQQGPSLYRS